MDDGFSLALGTRAMMGFLFLVIILLLRIVIFLITAALLTILIRIFT